MKKLIRLIALTSLISVYCFNFAVAQTADFKRFGDWTYSTKDGNYCEMMTTDMLTHKIQIFLTSGNAAYADFFFFYVNESASIDITDPSTLILSVVSGEGRKMSYRLKQTTAGGVNLVDFDDFKNLMLPEFKGKWTAAMFIDKDINGENVATMLSLSGFSKAFKAFSRCLQEIK